MSLGEFFWGLLAFYFIFFYFMILFRIIGDLFADHEAGGLAKTAWILFLLFVPFIAVFTYLIARGRGMTERARAKAEAAEAAQQDYIRRTVRNTAATATTETADDPAAKIEKARDLLASGAITQPEYDTLKAKAFA